MSRTLYENRVRTASRLIVMMPYAWVCHAEPAAQGGEDGGCLGAAAHHHRRRDA